MSTESDRQLVRVLDSTVRELRALQTAGWMRDPESRAHVDFLERGLCRARSRLARPDSPGHERGRWAPGSS